MERGRVGEIERGPEGEEERGEDRGRGRRTEGEVERGRRRRTIIHLIFTPETCEC